MRLRLTWLLLLCCACSPVSSDLGSAARQPIWGGAPAPDDAAVFRINNSMAACTSTLIAPRTLLTARHCAFSGTVVAENLPSSTDVFTVVETRTWEEAYPDGGMVDLALMLLDRAPPVAPLPWDWLTRSPPAGSPVRLVGYGGSDNGGSGTRRMVVTSTSFTLADPTSGQLVISGNADAGACYGDSGGPLLLIGADGGDEHVLAVNARLAGLECGAIASVLVPRYREFIEGWLSTHEDAGCPRDGRCVPGCTPVDWDCVCSADGQCTAACPGLDDPDCPADCRTNLRCSAAVCPRPDTDCTPPGESCFLDVQCEGRKCIDDPQHPGTYCSGSCDAGCITGLQCDPARDACIKPQRPEAALGEACTDGVTLCRSSECLEGRCRTPCTDDAQCTVAGEVCREPEPRFCAPKVVLPGLDYGHPAKGGCDTGSAQLPLVVLALGQLLSRRRRS